VKTTIKNRMRNAKRRIERRLAGERQDRGKPMSGAEGICVEMADKVRAIGSGGIGLVHQLARETGLVDAIDRRLPLLKIHRPYHESDHVLNLAYNAMCEGIRHLPGQSSLRSGELDCPTGRRGAGALCPARQPAEQLGL
jgi:hypothetical protein